MNHPQIALTNFSAARLQCAYHLSSCNTLLATWLKKKRISSPVWTFEEFENNFGKIIPYCRWVKKRRPKNAMRLKGITGSG